MTKLYIVVIIFLIGMLLESKRHTAKLISTHTKEIESLQLNINQLTNLLAIKDTENTYLLGSIENQNKEVLKYKQEIENSLEDYTKKIQQVEADRFKHIKYIEVKSNECNDIQDILQDIRSNGF